MQGDAEMASGAKSEATRSDEHSRMQTAQHTLKKECTRHTGEKNDEHSRMQTAQRTQNPKSKLTQDTQE